MDGMSGPHGVVPPTAQLRGGPTLTTLPLLQQPLHTTSGTRQGYQHASALDTSASKIGGSAQTFTLTQPPAAASSHSGAAGSQWHAAPPVSASVIAAQAELSIVVTPALLSTLASMQASLHACVAERSTSTDASLTALRMALCTLPGALTTAARACNPEHALPALAGLPPIPSPDALSLNAIIEQEDVQRVSSAMDVCVPLLRVATDALTLQAEDAWAALSRLTGINAVRAVALATSQVPQYLDALDAVAAFVASIRRVFHIAAPAPSPPLPHLDAPEFVYMPLIHLRRVKQRAARINIGSVRDVQRRLELPADAYGVDVWGDFVEDDEVCLTRMLHALATHPPSRARDVERSALQLALSTITPDARHAMTLRRAYEQWVVDSIRRDASLLQAGTPTPDTRTIMPLTPDALAALMRVVPPSGDNPTFHPAHVAVLIARRVQAQRTLLRAMRTACTAAITCQYADACAHVRDAVFRQRSRFLTIETRRTEDDSKLRVLTAAHDVCHELSIAAEMEGQRRVLWAYVAEARGDHHRRVAARRNFDVDDSIRPVAHMSLSPGMVRALQPAAAARVKRASLKDMLVAGQRLAQAELDRTHLINDALRETCLSSETLSMQYATHLDRGLRACLTQTPLLFEDKALLRAASRAQEVYERPQRSKQPVERLSTPLGGIPTHPGRKRRQQHAGPYIPGGRAAVGSARVLIRALETPDSSTLTHASALTRQSSSGSRATRAASKLLNLSMADATGVLFDISGLPATAKSEALSFSADARLESSASRATSTDAVYIHRRQALSKFDSVLKDCGRGSAYVDDEVAALRLRVAVPGANMVAILRLLIQRVVALQEVDHTRVAADASFASFARDDGAYAHDMALVRRVSRHVLNVPAPVATAVEDAPAGEDVSVAAPVYVLLDRDRAHVSLPQARMRTAMHRYPYVFFPTRSCRLATAVTDTPCSMNHRTGAGVTYVQCVRCGWWYHWMCTNLSPEHMREFMPRAACEDQPAAPAQRLFRCSACLSSALVSALEVHLEHAKVLSSVAAARALFGVMLFNHIRNSLVGVGLAERAAAVDPVALLTTKLRPHGGALPAALTRAASIAPPWSPVAVANTTGHDVDVDTLHCALMVGGLARFLVHHSLVAPVLASTCQAVVVNAAGAPPSSRPPALITMLEGTDMDEAAGADVGMEELAPTSAPYMQESAMRTPESRMVVASSPQSSGTISHVTASVSAAEMDGMLSQRCVIRTGSPSGPAMQLRAALASLTSSTLLQACALSDAAALQWLFRDSDVAAADANASVLTPHEQAIATHSFCEVVTASVNDVVEEWVRVLAMAPSDVHWALAPSADLPPPEVQPTLLAIRDHLFSQLSDDARAMFVRAAEQWWSVTSLPAPAVACSQYLDAARRMHAASVQYATAFRRAQGIALDPALPIDVALAAGDATSSRYPLLSHHAHASAGPMTLSQAQAGCVPVPRVLQFGKYAGVDEWLLTWRARTLARNREHKLVLRYNALHGSASAATTVIVPFASDAGVATGHDGSKDARKHTHARSGSSRTQTDAASAFLSLIPRFTAAADGFQASLPDVLPLCATACTAGLPSRSLALPPRAAIGAVLVDASSSRPPAIMKRYRVATLQTLPTSRLGAKVVACVLGYTSPAPAPASVGASRLELLDADAETVLTQSVGVSIFVDDCLPLFEAVDFFMPSDSHATDAMAVCKIAVAAITRQLRLPDVQAGVREDRVAARLQTLRAAAARILARDEQEQETNAVAHLRAYAAFTQVHSMSHDALHLLLLLGERWVMQHVAASSMFTAANSDVLQSAVSIKKPRKVVGSVPLSGIVEDGSKRVRKPTSKAVDDGLVVEAPASAAASVRKKKPKRKFFVGAAPPSAASRAAKLQRRAAASAAAMAASLPPLNEDVARHGPIWNAWNVQQALMDVQESGLPSVDDSLRRLMPSARSLHQPPPRTADDESPARDANAVGGETAESGDNGGADAPSVALLRNKYITDATRRHIRHGVPSTSLVTPATAAGVMPAPAVSPAPPPAVEPLPATSSPVSLTLEEERIGFVSSVAPPAWFSSRTITAAADADAASLAATDAPATAGMDAAPSAEAQVVEGTTVGHMAAAGRMMRLRAVDVVGPALDSARCARPGCEAAALPISKYCSAACAVRCADIRLSAAVKSSLHPELLCPLPLPPAHEDVSSPPASTPHLSVRTAAYLDVKVVTDECNRCIRDVRVFRAALVSYIRASLAQDDVAGLLEPPVVAAIPESMPTPTVADDADTVRTADLIPAPPAAPTITAADENAYILSTRVHVTSAVQERVPLSHEAIVASLSDYAVALEQERAHAQAFMLADTIEQAPGEDFSDDVPSTLAHVSGVIPPGVVWTLEHILSQVCGETYLTSAETFHVVSAATSLAPPASGLHEPVIARQLVWHAWHEALLCQRVCAAFLLYSDALNDEAYLAEVRWTHGVRHAKLVAMYTEETHDTSVWRAAPHMYKFTLSHGLQLRKRSTAYSPASARTLPADIFTTRAAVDVLLRIAAPPHSASTRARARGKGRHVRQRGRSAYSGHAYGSAAQQAGDAGDDEDAMGAEGGMADTQRVEDAGDKHMDGGAMSSPEAALSPDVDITSLSRAESASGAEATAMQDEYSSSLTIAEMLANSAAHPVVASVAGACVSVEVMDAEGAPSLVIHVGDCPDGAPLSVTTALDAIACHRPHARCSTCGLSVSCAALAVHAVACASAVAAYMNVHSSDMDERAMHVVGAYNNWLQLVQVREDADDDGARAHPRRSRHRPHLMRYAASSVFPRPTQLTLELVDSEAHRELVASVWPLLSWLSTPHARSGEFIGRCGFPLNLQRVTAEHEAEVIAAIAGSSVGNALWQPDRCAIRVLSTIRATAAASPHAATQPVGNEDVTRFGTAPLDMMILLSDTLKRASSVLRSGGRCSAARNVCSLHAGWELAMLNWCCSTERRARAIASAVNDASRDATGMNTPVPNSAAPVTVLPEAYAVAALTQHGLTPWGLQRVPAPPPPAAAAVAHAPSPPLWEEGRVALTSRPAPRVQSGVRGFQGVRASSAASASPMAHGPLRAREAKQNARSFMQGYAREVARQDRMPSRRTRHAVDRDEDYHEGD